VRRWLHFAQSVIIGSGIALGAIWPSIYTLIAIAVLPAFFVALAAVAHPRLVDGRGWRRWLRTYLQGGTAASAFVLVWQAGWMVFTYSAPIDVVVEAGVAGPVLVVYGVADSEPLREWEGRRVYEIPPSRVLLTQAGPNDGWWLHGDRRFFARQQDGSLRMIPGKTGRSGRTQWNGCSARVDWFILLPEKNVPEELYSELDARESWKVECRGGQLTRR